MLNELSPIPPPCFFHVSAHVRKKVGKLTYLPDMSGFLNEQSFGRVAVIWSPGGLTLHVQVKKPLEESLYPRYRDSDSLEVFIDTRNLKNAQSVHRFCHHFVFLPEEVDGVQAQEVTRFRLDETHELAAPELFVVQVGMGKRDYEMEINIPKEALHGYDPSEFKRLGFSYQLNRSNGAPQHFNLSSRFFSLEKHPGLWATLILT
ncbi:MAG: hypothetical protein KDK61_04500 [Simkania sp.]|uniref:Carbohydrate-binding domain-containing protein n=1 Tax=Simkania negevensis (strain ATCC VR-1471 / DSM 27360 / Z) TaxID=331113 RepID=F8L6K0_SIMNZ|nr:sugar-binding protein [Simkania negevensis]MCB1083547.1 hypothetical protein [Simkania sp.]CCB88343.1 putative uncharacterized protein [Simkania negevensis Z]